MQWLPAPFAAMLCLVLLLSTAGDTDVIVHESGIIRVSLRTFLPHDTPLRLEMSQDPFLLFRTGNLVRGSATHCLYGQDPQTHCRRG